MVGRDNAHIPKNSWPSFSWYVIEFAIVFAVANLIAFQIIPAVDEMIGQQNLLICEQGCHGCLNVLRQKKKCPIQGY